MITATKTKDMSIQLDLFILSYAMKYASKVEQQMADYIYDHHDEMFNDLGELEIDKEKVFELVVNRLIDNLDEIEADYVKGKEELLYESLASMIDWDHYLIKDAIITAHVLVKDAAEYHRDPMKYNGMRQSDFM